MITLDYEELKCEFIKHLHEYEDVVFSTSLNNKVTSRTMSYVNDQLNLYFMTSKRSNKCKQIKGNQHISLCTKNVQIEGIATILGHPMDDENRKVSELIKSKHPEYYKRFAHF